MNPFRRVPVNEPVITADARTEVAEAMAAGWVSSAGPVVPRFEARFAEFLGVRHAVATSSGTTALHLALAALGIGPGDEVIVPDFTMIAAVAAVLYTGARPVFVDCEPDTFTLDPALVPGAITPRTRAILPVHAYGHPADLTPILAVAAAHKIRVVEDAAEAHGARYRGRRCGAWGDLGCFSFYGNKIITTGEGGMVVTDDDALAARARSLRDLGHHPRERFRHDDLGFSYRMSSLQAACGIGQLAHVEEFLDRKRWMAAEYDRRLADVPRLRLPVTRPWAENVFWMYTVLLDEGFPLSRTALLAALADRGVETREFFRPGSSQPMVERALGRQDPCPVSRRIAARGFYLPSGLALTAAEIEYVAAVVHDVVEQAPRCA